MSPVLLFLNLHHGSGEWLDSEEGVSTMLGRLALILAACIGAWVYQGIHPPPPRICGSPNGPPVTAPRIRLRDGRYLAYKETGLTRDKARHKIVLVHGFSGSRQFTLPASNVMVEDLGLYFVSYDRAGYGESDPNPGRSVKSEALDIQDLADELGLGTKFYVIGVSMGSHSVWGCIKYIPHRLAGAVLLVPVVNYWWPSFPPELSREAYRLQLLQDQWALRVAHYAPSLLYWWMTQKWFPSSAVASRHPGIWSRQDKELLHKLMQKRPTEDKYPTQQGNFESLHRDMMVGFGSWDFDPMELENPFSANESSVHIWQGKEDRLVPFSLQRYVARKLPWIKYHEVPDGGHMMLLADGVTDAILRALFLGGDSYSIDI